jgi:signal recognition particle receptor subunit beta
VQINMQEREITVKVVYYGPALSGKTTNLQQLHQLINASARGKMVTLDTSDDRTLYFDFLPIQFGTQNGFSVKIKLFTVPGQVMHKSTRKVVLAGADAVAFIADSQRSSASANAYSWRDMEANLKSNGLDFESIPKVVQSRRSARRGATWLPARRSRSAAKACSRHFESCCASCTGASTSAIASPKSSVCRRKTSSKASSTAWGAPSLQRSSRFYRTPSQKPACVPPPTSLPCGA